MAHIRKRKTTKGKVRWIVEVRRKGHRPICKTLGTKEAAQIWAREAERELERGGTAPTFEAQRHTLAEAVDRYIEDHLPLLAASDRRTRKQQLVWWKGEIGSVALANVTPAVVSDVRRGLVKRVSGPTANRYLAALSRVFSLAIDEWLWMTDNPVSRVSHSPEKQGRVRFLSDEERHGLLDQCKKSDERRLYPLVLFALTTGARQGELLGLKWRDVEVINGRATLSDTKNGDRRAIFFPGEAGRVLQNLSKTPHISGYVFANRRGYRRFPEKEWKRALSRAEIEDFRFHDLRHTAASYMAMSGASLAEIAAFLGHRTLAMVKRYSHIADSHSEIVATRMVARFLS